MSEPIFFAPLRVPVIDARTGLMSREWYLFFQAMFLRVGGTSGTAPTSDDVLQGPAGFVDVFALQSSDAAGQVPVSIPFTFDDPLGDLRQLQDQVAELSKRLQDMQQGTVTL